MGSLQFLSIQESDVDQSKSSSRRSLKEPDSLSAPFHFHPNRPGLRLGGDAFGPFYHSLFGLFWIIENALTSLSVHQESREQIDPSLMPAIKAAVGGSVGKKRRKEDGKRAGSGAPPSGVVAALQGDRWKRLLFGFTSIFSGGGICVLLKL